MTSSAPTAATAPAFTVPHRPVDVSVWPQTAWRVLHAEVVEHGTEPVTTYPDLPLGQWVEATYRDAAYYTRRRMSLNGWSVPRDRFRAVLLVRAGVPVPDLYRLATSPGGLDADGPAGAAIRLQSAMLDLSMADPSLTIRDGLGWLLAHVGSGRQFWDAQREVSAWAEAGLGALGWLYAAAGLTVTEALACSKDGDGNLAQLQMMAALRGALLPA